MRFLFPLQVLQFVSISSVYESQAPKTDIDIAAIYLILPANHSLV